MKLTERSPEAKRAYFQGYAAGIEAAINAVDGFWLEARDTEWDDGVNDAKAGILDCLRSWRLLGMEPS